MENYDDVVDYSPEPGELLPWMGTVGSPTHPLMVQLAEEIPSEVRGDFFSQFSGVSGLYPGQDLEALSWLGGVVGSGVVSSLGSSAINSPLPCSVSWCGSTPLLSEGSFSPIQCGFSPSSATTNLSWSFPDPTVTVCLQQI
jgi:hypothetical protein